MLIIRVEKVVQKAIIALHYFLGLQKWSFDKSNYQMIIRGKSCIISNIFQSSYIHFEMITCYIVILYFTYSQIIFDC